MGAGGASGGSVSGAALRRRRGLLHGPATPYLFILPAFLVYAAFMLYPLVKAVQISFYDWNGMTLATPAGFSNYVTVFTDQALLTAFGHALILMVFYAVIPLVLGLGVAAVLHRSRVRGLGFFRTVVFLPQVIAMVVVAIAWRQIYAPTGALNSVLSALHLPTRGWLGDYSFALPAVGFIGTWVQTGLVVVLLMAGMARTPTDIYEAARLDGANPVQEFFAITLPAVRGEITVALTLTIIAALKTFDLIYITTSGGPGHQTSVPSYEVFNQAFNQNKVGLACTIGVVLTVVIFLINLVVNRIAERDA